MYKSIILGAFHLVTQVDTSSVFVTYWMSRKKERCLYWFVSLRSDCINVTLFLSET